MIINTLAGRTGSVIVNEINVMAFHIQSLEMELQVMLTAKVNKR